MTDHTMKEMVREILIYLGFVLLAGLLWWSLSREHHDQVLVAQHLQAEKVFDEKESQNTMTEKVIDVNIETPSMNDGVQLRLFPSHVKVIVRVSKEDYVAATAQSLRATVSWNPSADKNGSSDLLSVKVKSKDKRIKVLRVEPDAVEYLLENNQ